MALEMVKDVVQFIVLLSGIFISFAVALVIVLKPILVRGTNEDAAVDMVQDQCSILVLESAGEEDVEDVGGLGAVMCCNELWSDDVGH